MEVKESKDHGVMIHGAFSEPHPPDDRKLPFQNRWIPLFKLESSVVEIIAIQIRTSTVPLVFIVVTNFIHAISNNVRDLAPARIAREA